jgi:tight adherence protein C
MGQASAFFSANLNIVILALVFASVAMFTVALGIAATSWVNIRRRVSQATARSRAGIIQPQSITWSTAPEFLKGLVPADETKKSELTRLLHSAGYHGMGALVWFQGIRIVAGLLFGMLTAVFYGRVYPEQSHLMAIAASIMMTFFGYILPRSVLSMQRDRLLEQYRQGFPDFLDLQVVCIGAGASIESAIERASRDTAGEHPALARNLGFMTLELGAGKSIREALDNLAARLAIPEARSYATLVQQSEEFGTNLTNSLRIYSDEMRQKRLARAEEKAHALPVKLVLPVALFIFPVVLGVTLMPVAFKLFKAIGL